ncbi:MAG: hypothetical protein MJY42_02045 [Bacteroidales bacterium]|nr:hypothetical protein [Bacteroidales bacterium]
MSFFRNIPYHLLRAVLVPLSALPLGFHRAAGRFLGLLAGYVVRYRRAVVLENLRASFPDRTDREIKQICRDFYLHLGTVIGEAVWFGSCTDRERLRRSHIVEMENPELLNRLYELGPSTMALASHSGNFELYGGYSTYASYNGGMKYADSDLAMVYRKLSNSAWDRYMYRNRLAAMDVDKDFDGLVETSYIMRYVCMHRNEKKLYTFITDQFPYGPVATAEVDFLGRRTKAMMGGISLARKFSMPVVYLGMPARRGGGYTIRYTLICEDASLCDADYIVKEYYRLLEEDIKAQPENWLWSHRRWKTI